MHASKKSAGKLWAVILAGGSGTRFWPESRQNRPKQFLPFFKNKTLFELCLARLTPLIPRERILVITNAQHVAMVQRLGHLPAKNVIGEPVGRNTAPTAVLAASVALRRDPAAVLAIIPSDHYIGKEAAFRQALRAAERTAVENHLPVTFGIHPEYPHTGYGYLERGSLDSHQNGLRVYRLKAFHEKPTLETAKKYLVTGRFYWNAGMFVWKAEDLLLTAKKLLPKAYHVSERIAKASSLMSAMKKEFKFMPNISIDYGLMEKLHGKILTIPLAIDWHDLGSWQAYARFFSKDSHGNVGIGKALFVESHHNFVSSKKKLIALIDTHGYTVVDTDDALLICPSHKLENVRKVVEELKRRQEKQYL